MVYHVVKTRLSEGSRASYQCDVTRKQRPMKALVSFTLQRKLLYGVNLLYGAKPECRISIHRTPYQLVSLNNLAQVSE